MNLSAHAKLIVPFDLERGSVALADVLERRLRVPAE